MQNNSIVQRVELLRISKHFLSKQFPDLPDSAHVHLQDTVNVTFDITCANKGLSRYWVSGFFP